MYLAHIFDESLLHLVIALFEGVGYVDDMGQIGVNWDNGSGLSLVPGEDTFSKVSEPEKAKSDRGMSR